MCRYLLSLQKHGGKLDGRVIFLGACLLVALDGRLSSFQKGQIDVGTLHAGFFNFSPWDFYDTSAKASDVMRTVQFASSPNARKARQDVPGNGPRFRDTARIFVLVSRDAAAKAKRSVRTPLTISSFPFKRASEISTQTPISRAAGQHPTVLRANADDQH